MPELVQLKGKDPILEGVDVASTAQSKGIAADLFGEVSKKAAETAVQMHKEHSNAMLMNATAQSNAVMTDTQIEMLKNPNKANEIIQGAQKDLSTINHVQLSSSDKKTLESLNTMNSDKLRVKAAIADAKQNKLNNTVNFWDSHNQVMELYSNLLSSGNFDKADKVRENVIESSKSAAIEGLITTQAYSNINKSIAGLHQRMQEMHDILGKEDATAADAHIANLDPYSNNNLDVANLPANHGTESLSNHYIGQATNEDINSAVVNWNITPKIQAAIAQLSDKEFAKVSQKILGSRVAHGILNSNPSYTDITNRVSFLENTPNLNTKDQTELKVYQDYMKELNEGSFWDVLGRSTLGAQAINEWNSDKATVENYIAYALTAEGQAKEKERLSIEVDNNFIDKGIFIANASHMDPRLIRPIPKEIASNVQAAFKFDGDASSVLNTISRLKPRLRGYLANQMSTPAQKQIVESIGLGHDNNMSPEFSTNLINANKDKMDYSALKVEDKISDATVRSQIANNLSDVVDYFSSMGGTESAQRINAFVDGGLNYVKYRALQNGDFTIDNLDKYVNEFSQEMGNAYNMSSRRFGTFNLSQLPMSNSQQDTLQNYVYAEAQKNFMGTHKGDMNYEANLSKLDINVFVDNTNHIRAVDDSGNNLFYEPYSEMLMSRAVHHSHPVKVSKKEKKDMDAYYKSQSLWYMSD
jgi:hypothetical protein